MRVFNILNLGAGWQSSKIYLDMVSGHLPPVDAALFADTQWEPVEVYEHLKWLESLGGPQIVRVTAGNLRQDAIEFRFQHRSMNGRRYASIPVFVKNLDGSEGGRIRRQCTSEYKIRPIELWIRRTLLGMKHGQRIPKGVTVRSWFGISADEYSRAVFPGRWDIKAKVIKDVFGQDFEVKNKRWIGRQWSEFVYPLLNEIRMHDRRIVVEKFYPNTLCRSDVGDWLKSNYPDRNIPRSACIGCPFHDNAEWKHMRDNRPEQWADACDFDDQMRMADEKGQSNKKILVGLPFLHKQRVPLRVVNLDGQGEKTGGGCGSIGDGLDGFCGL